MYKFQRDPQSDLEQQVAEIIALARKLSLVEQWQVVHSILEELEKETLLFGKRDTNIYYLEVNHPFTIIEGFGIALSNLDRKILVR